MIILEIFRGIASKDELVSLSCISCLGMDLAVRGLRRQEVLRSSMRRAHAFVLNVPRGIEVEVVWECSN